MRATGIVRRIDELGRIGIPKEIRRSMRIKDGDPMEIFTDKDGIHLAKYSPLGSLGSIADTFCKGASKSTGLNIMITDRDMVLSARGYGQVRYIGQMISAELEKQTFSRQVATLRKGAVIPLIKDDATDYSEQIIVPITVDGEVVGALVGITFAGASSIDITCQKVLEAIALIIGTECEG